MTVLFDGDVHVDYGFIYIDSGVGGWDEDIEVRAGQHNGLLGAAQPGFLMISTSMHTGLVPLRVKVHPSAPPLDDTNTVRLGAGRPTALRRRRRAGGGVRA